MQNNIQTICSNIVSQYRHDTNVLGIMLCGSAARNKFDKYSDVDLYILLKKKTKISRSNFVKNGIRIDIILDTLDEANNYLREDKRNVRRMTSHLLKNGKILFQRDGTLKKIQQVAASNLKLKTKFSPNEILMHKYSIDDFWGEVQRDAKNKDYIAFGLNSQLLINNIIELFLKLSGEFFRQPNEMKKILCKLDEQFSHQIVDYYKSRGFNKRLAILSKLVTNIYIKSRGPLPDRWSIKR